MPDYIEDEPDRVLPDVVLEPAIRKKKKNNWWVWLTVVAAVGIIVKDKNQKNGKR